MKKVDSETKTNPINQNTISDQHISPAYSTTTSGNNPLSFLDAIPITTVMKIKNN